MRRAAAVLLSTFLFMAFPLQARSDDDHQIRDAMQAGGDRLVALQNPDGGWFFVVGDADCGSGPGVSCPNTFGVTALGLLAAFRVTHEPDHLSAAQRAADALVAKHAAAPPCDGNPATSADRPFTVDVSFLLDAFGRAHGPSGDVYRSTAFAWFACVVADFPSGAARADNRINRRIAQGLNNLGAWDASLDVRAALAVGQSEYALDEARQIIARQADWDVDDADCPGCNLLAKGLFIAATEELKQHQDVRAARERWRDDLLASTSADGSWGGDTQTTAYAVMGLATMPEGNAGQAAVAQAVGFLLSMQHPDGGFGVGIGFETTEVTEVDGEVLQALAAAR